MINPAPFIPNLLRTLQAAAEPLRQGNLPRAESILREAGAAMADRTFDACDRMILGKVLARLRVSGGTSPLLAPVEDRLRSA